VLSLWSATRYVALFLKAVYRKDEEGEAAERAVEGPPSARGS